MSNGKGSRPRPVDLDKWDANYNYIFRGKTGDKVAKPSKPKLKGRPFPLE